MAADPEQTSAEGKKTPALLRMAGLALVLAVLAILFKLLPLQQYVKSLSAWIESLGIWGPLVLAVLYIGATILFVPGVVLTLAAGAMFGLGIGVVTVSIGSTLGAACCFLIARYLAREKVAAWAEKNRRFQAIDAAIGEGSWKVVALMRLSPAIPFNLQNYLFGLTSIGFWPYILTSWIAMLPGTFLYVYLGDVAGAALGDDRTVGEWIILGVGLLATLAVTIYITRLARQKLQEHTDESTGD